MAKIRTSNRSDLALALGLGLCCACGGAGALETATEMPKTPRRPDGVVLEPPPALPSPQDRASAAGIVALREPLADKDVEEIVRAYVRGFEREDVDALIQLLAQEATPLGRAGGRNQLVEVWRTKMKSFEYQRLAGSEVARISQIEKHTYETLGAPGASITRPSEMRPGDLYVRVPIATPRVGTDQLFGDVLVLLLRREDGRLKIAGQADESGQ
ncbi:MAG: hypothetical protein KF819_07915 [Labilithrix sp.]|nr:hypothetical protein [Labilithrix sp.]